MKELRLKFGVMTDNHFAPEIPQTKVRTLAAMKLFREHLVDAVLDCGDITDRYLPEEQEKFRRMYEEMWPDPAARPEKIWIPAGHDIQKNPLGKSLYPEIAARLGLATPAPLVTLKGYTFIGVPQGGDLAQWEARIGNAAADSGGKPVFVLTHEYAVRTLLHSDFSGSEELRRILDRFPQVIQFCGHSHHPVFHERSIWQGGFTAVNAGSPYYWKDRTHGRGSRRHESADALVCELYDDELKIRRFDLLGPGVKEFEPWRVPLPFDPASAPYNPERRANELPVPEFPAGSALRFSAPEEPLVRGKLTIPVAEPGGAVDHYRVTLWEDWREIAAMDYFPGTWPGMQQDGYEDFLLPPAMLQSGAEYRCRAVPVSQYDREGKPLELAFRSPQSAFCGIAGAEEVKFTLDGAEFPLAADGSFTLSREQMRQGWNRAFHLEVPAAIAAKRQGTVLVMEFESQPQGSCAWMAGGDVPDYKRHFLGPEAEVCHRHVFDLSALKGEKLFIALYDGDGGTFRIRSLKFYRTGKAIL